jgi:hypothetical protein
MAILETRSRILADISNPESQIASMSSKTILEDADGTTEMAIDVPPATSKLFVVMSAAGETAAGEFPKDARVDLVDPDGQAAQSAVPPDVSTAGQVIVVDNPRAGRWRAVVRYVKNSAVVVGACSMKDYALAEIKEKWPNLACSGCKEVLLFVVAGVVVYVGAASAAAAGASAAVIAVASGKFGLPEFVVKHILDRMWGESLDRLTQQVCGLLRMCGG